MCTRKPIKDGGLIYHLTSLENLESTLRNGSLPRSKLKAFDDVAEADIIDFRGKVGLNDYVPFHFFSKNPFDGRVQLDYPDKEFAYICVTRYFAANNGFLIVTQHPKSLGEDCHLYDYKTGMRRIEWDIMEQRNYTNPLCRNICMAECLSPRPIRSRNFSHIFVRDNRSFKIVHEMGKEMMGEYTFKVMKNDKMFL